MWFYGFKSSITAGEGEYKGIWGLDKIMKKETKFEKSEKYPEYEMLKAHLNKIENQEDTWFSEMGQACIDTIFYSKNIKVIKASF